MPTTDGPKTASILAAAVTLSGEPARLKFHRNVRAQHEPLGSEEAARAVGVYLEFAALHTDRLVKAEMLDFGC